MKDKVKNMTLHEMKVTEKRVHFNPGTGFIYIEKIDGLGNHRINRMKYRVAIFI
jgi:hypothetical protein